MRFTVINNHNNAIIVETTLANPYESIHIRPRDSFTLTVLHYNNNPIVVQAIDQTTRQPITLNGLKSVFITPKRILGPALIFGAPNRIQGRHRHFSVRAIGNSRSLRRGLRNVKAPQCELEAKLTTACI